MNGQRQVLCVDDEPLLLEGLERTLGQSFEVVTESKPLAALALLERRERDFVAILSDMRMPLMDGAKFLSCAAELAPDATRVLLTGHAELSAAISAVNDGGIFRFLCKPCPPHELLGAVEAAAEHHRLKRVERELLEQTLAGSIRLLAEVLILVAPRIFNRTQRVQTYVLYMAQRLGLSELWRFELAACLSMLGCVSLPEDMVTRALSGGSLEEEEARAFAEHPLVAERLLQRIPRFEEIAKMVGLQAALDAAVDSELAPDVITGARLLNVARSVEQLVFQGASEAEAATRLLGQSDPKRAALLKLMLDYHPVALEGELKELRVNQMTANMALEQDVKTKTGVVIVPAGKQLSQLLLERLWRFSRAGLLLEPVWVRVPPSSSTP